MASSAQLRREKQTTELMSKVASSSVAFLSSFFVSPLSFFGVIGQTNGTGSKRCGKEASMVFGLCQESQRVMRYVGTDINKAKEMRLGQNRCRK